MKKFHLRRNGDVSWHDWGDCTANVFSSKFDTGKCIQVLNRTDPKPPQWFLEECRREKGLSPTNQQQQQQQQQYQFAGVPPVPVPAGMPPQAIPVQGGSYMFQPPVNQQPPVNAPAPGTAMVLQAGQASVNQQQQVAAGGSYMNLPVAPQPSQFVYRADGTLGWRR